jgi:hypothetical protein
VGNISDEGSQIMAYADDVLIMGERLQDVKEVFISLVEQINKMGLKINKKDRIYDNITRTLQ